MDELENIEEKELDKLLPTEEEMAAIRNALLRSKFPVPDIDAEWAKISDQMKAEDSGETEEEMEEPSRPYYKYVVGAIVAAAACLACVFLLHAPESQLPANVAMVSAPQKNSSVTITDANGQGKELKSPSVSFVEQTGSESAVAEGEMVSMETPRGKDCHVTLPDGTKVWLNAESKLDFPSQFGKGKRLVHLKGEAYFEVTKDKRHPFVVVNDYFTTTVLGTVFNVRAYDEHDANVVLVSGRVAVSTGFLSETKYIKPGQIAICNGRNKWEIKSEETYPYTQRKEGYFYFDHLSLHKIMAEIGRWYNKTVVFENTDLMSMKLHFVAERKQSLASIVDNLNQMDGVNITVGKNEIVVR